MDDELKAQIYARGVRDGLLQASDIANTQVVLFTKFENTTGADHASGASLVASEIGDAVTKIEVESPRKWQLSKRSS